MGSHAGPIMGAQGAGSLLSAYGAYEAGQSNSAIYRFNADYARTQAEQTLQSGEYIAGVSDLKETQLAGTQAAGFAGQGVVSGAGSAGTVVDASAAMSEQDKAMERLNARRQAYGFEVAASNDDFQGDMAKRLGNMQAGASLLQGAGSIATTAMMLG